MQGVQVQSLIKEAKIPHAWLPENQNIKRTQYCNKFNKDFKNGLHQGKKKIFKKLVFKKKKLVLLTPASVLFPLSSHGSQEGKKAFSKEKYIQGTPVA